MSIVLREGLGRPLTYAELDENFRTVAQVGDTASVAAAAATDAAAQAVQSAQSAAESAAAAGGKVSLTGNETVAGVKTFSSSPQLPTPAATSADTTAQTTAGSLAQMQSFGVGGFVPAVADLNTLAGGPTTFFRAGRSALNLPLGLPVAVVGHYDSYGATAGAIWCTTLTASATNQSRSFYQAYNNSVGQGWREIASLDAAAFTTSLQVAGPVKVGQYTLATLPSASGFNGYEIDVTNATGDSKRCRSNGTVWQILNTTTTVS